MKVYVIFKNSTVVGNAYTDKEEAESMLYKLTKERLEAEQDSISVHYTLKELYVI